MKNQPSREEIIFNAVLQLSSHDERAGYLKGACGDDAQLRQGVENLIREHQVADSATNLTYYSLNGGLSVLSASLDPVTRTVLALGTSAQTPSTNYTLIINGVQDRFGNIIATNTRVSLNLSNSAPIITAQPQPQATYPGGAVTFNVGVSSALPMTYQWYKESNPIVGQTKASLTLNNVQSEDAGNYNVVIGNSNGTTSSDSALLTVLTPGNSLRWRDIANSAVWDTGTSPNWINVSNSQGTVFNTGDQVLFADDCSSQWNGFTQHYYRQFQRQ